MDRAQAVRASDEAPGTTALGRSASVTIMSAAGSRRPGEPLVAGVLWRLSSHNCAAGRIVIRGMECVAPLGGSVTSLLRFAQGARCGPLTAEACQVDCMSVTRWCRSTISSVPVSVSTTRACNLLLVDVALEARQVRCVESINSDTIPL